MTLRNMRTDSKGLAGGIREALYCARCESRRGGSVTPRADAGNANRPPRPFPQAPLRPSEGLPQASRRVLNPCQGDRRAAHSPGNAGAEGFRSENRGCSGRQTAGEATRSALNATRAKPSPVTKASTDVRVTNRGRWLVNLPAAPPQNIEAERRVLGTLLAYYTPEMVTVLTGIGLKWSDFSWDAHRIVYRAVLKMNFDHEHVDTLTVARFLVCRPHPRCGSYLGAAGGEARLEELVCHASANGWREAARIVAEDGRWRRWLAATFDALESIHARDEDAFWAAVGRVREDVLPGEPLRVIEGGERAA